MLNKVLHRDVPFEFQIPFDEYSQFDEGFLRNAMSPSDKPPSIACMISDVYARRNGNGCIEKQSKLLFEAYQAYIAAIFDFRTPVLVSSTMICQKFGAESTLREVGVQDPAASIGADMAQVRRKILNYPVIDSEEIFVNELVSHDFGAVEGNVVIETEQCRISVSALAYKRSKRSDHQHLSKLHELGFIEIDADSACVVDYLIEPKEESLEGQQIYYSTVFQGSVDVSVVNSDLDTLFRDSLWFLDGLAKGTYIEAPSAVQRAWAKYSKATSPSKVKSLAPKLTQPRQYIRP